MASGGDRVAVVTGGNKGIGYHIAEQLLASREYGTVVIACRDAGRAAAAAKALGTVYEVLDLTDPNSIDAFPQLLAEKYGRLDCLVNNAAIAFKGRDPTPFPQQTVPTLRANFYGTVRLTEACLPLLSAGKQGTVVNVASMAGALRQVHSTLQAESAVAELAVQYIRLRTC